MIFPIIKKVEDRYVVTFELTAEGQKWMADQRLNVKQLDPNKFFPVGTDIPFSEAIVSHSSNGHLKYRR